MVQIINEKIVTNNHVAEYKNPFHMLIFLLEFIDTNSSLVIVSSHVLNQQ